MLWFCPAELGKISSHLEWWINFQYSVNENSVGKKRSLKALVQLAGPHLICKYLSPINKPGPPLKRAALARLSWTDWGGGTTMNQPVHQTHRCEPVLLEYRGRKGWIFILVFSLIQSFDPCRAYDVRYDVVLRQVVLITGASRAADRASCDQPGIYWSIWSRISKALWIMSRLGASWWWIVVLRSRAALSLWGWMLPPCLAGCNDGNIGPPRPNSQYSVGLGRGQAVPPLTGKGDGKEGRDEGRK